MCCMSVSQAHPVCLFAFQSDTRTLNGHTQAGNKPTDRGCFSYSTFLFHLQMLITENANLDKKATGQIENL